MKNKFTIKDLTRVEYIEKKSRFIAFALPVNTQNKVKDFLLQCKKEYSGATHICYAYILSSGEQRFSDAGEPSGTAGKPLLQFLQKKRLTDVCFVVIRYYGGIKLGTGGLQRAYTKGAIKSLQQNIIVPIYKKDIYEIILDYEKAKKLEGKNSLFKVLDKEYGDKVIFSLSISEDDFRAAKLEIEKILAQKIVLNKKEN